MRHQFFQKAVDAVSSAGVIAGISAFSVIYFKAMIHTYHEHCEHVKKYGSYKQDSTAWSRFCNTYLPLFSLIPLASTHKHGDNDENTKSIAPGK